MISSRCLSAHPVHTGAAIISVSSAKLDEELLRMLARRKMPVAKRCNESQPAPYRSGRTDRWRKVKCWTKSALVVVGTAVDKKTGAPIALLAEDAAFGLRFAGGALITLDGRQRELFKSVREAHEAAAALKKRGFKNTSVFEPKDLHHRGDDFLPTHLLQLASTLERR